MQSPRYFRDQAGLCLESARNMSDHRAAENLGATASRVVTVSYE
jgi:hypothetical protein